MFSLLLILLLAGLARITGGRVLLPLLAFLSAAAFLQSRFMLGLAGHTPFDGSLIDWDALHGLAWVELAVLALLASVFVGLRNRVQALSTISLFILLFLVAGLAHQLAVNWEKLTPADTGKAANDAYLDGFYRLSGQRDVIHVVPDQAQGAMLHDILVGDQAHYAAVFDGFTMFTQATGRFKSTYPSVVFYMSGEAPEPEYDLVQVLPYTWDYIADTLEEKSIVTTLARNGFDAYGFQFHPRVYCKGGYTACAGTHDEVFAASVVMSPARRLANAVLAGLDIGLFQSSPVVLRKQLFNDGNWFLKQLGQGNPTHSGILDLFTARVRRDGGAGTYNYFHHAGAHAPLLFDRNCNYVGPQKVNQQGQREQMLCTLAQLERMLAALKDRGLYDSSLVVINGDHGSPWLPDGYPHEAGDVISAALMGSASTLLMIKPPGARGGLRFSDFPASLGDVPATIAGLLGIEAPHPGVALFGEHPERGRERQYYAYDMHWKTHHLQHLPDVARYRIRGNVFDERSWVPPNTAGAEGLVSQLRMDDEKFLAYTTGFSLLEQHQTPVRWVNGDRASASLQPPPAGPVALVIETYVPPTLEGQWMDVSVNGEFVARLDAAELQKRRNIVPLPDALPRGGFQLIEFRMGKTFRPEHESRDLSVLFSYIGLVPAG